MPAIEVFDNEETRTFSESRRDFLHSLLTDLRPRLGLHSALDIGCALGDFSDFLRKMGLQVTGIDARAENIAEAKRRYPGIDFATGDAEKLNVGHFDLVLCLGLLYHLENPLLVVRKLHDVTAKVLVVESMCIPDKEPTMRLFDEGDTESQGMGRVAFYPSESCLVKMLQCSGFPFVYRFAALPDNHLYRSTLWRKPMRTMLAASKVGIDGHGLVKTTSPWFMPSAHSVPWVNFMGRLRSRLKRLVP